MGVALEKQVHAGTGDGLGVSMEHCCAALDVHRQ